MRLARPDLLSSTGRAFGAIIALIVLIVMALPLSAAAQSDPFAVLPGWPTERVAEIIPIFASACPRLDRAFHAACAEVGHVPRGDEVAARKFVEWAFRPAYIGDAQFTGYFELDVQGSRTRGGPYQWPLLRPPPEPRHYSRAQILGGALAGRGLELVWFTSAADLYFVQLQGSARVHLPDGAVMRVGGAAQNGFGSIPSADLFGDAGIPNHDLSIPAIRAWAASHPAEAEARLRREQAYFFFAERSIRSDQGPLGALGVPLAPLRSAAVDPKLIRFGSLMWVSTEISASHQPLQRLVMAHDSGEPIHGRQHVDLFFGPGPQAEAVGGRENARGGLWVLVPR